MASTEAPEKKEVEETKVSVLAGSWSAGPDRWRPPGPGSSQQPPQAPDARSNVPPQPTPVFGSGTAFGAGTGFAGFTGVSSSAAPARAAEASGGGAGGDDEEEADPEEECHAEFKPLVQLDEVETSTGEEDEEGLLDL